LLIDVKVTEETFAVTSNILHFYGAKSMNFASQHVRPSLNSARSSCFEAAAADSRKKRMKPKAVCFQERNEAANKRAQVLCSCRSS